MMTTMLTLNALCFLIIRLALHAILDVLQGDEREVDVMELTGSGVTRYAVVGPLASHLPNVM